MLDSSAKIPSGLLRGNVNQFGDFDQCLGVTARVKVDEKTVKVQGKYCLATLDLHALIPDMKVPVNFMQSRGFIRANMRDVSPIKRIIKERGSIKSKNNKNFADTNCTRNLFKFLITRDDPVKNRLNLLMVIKINF